MYDLLLIVLACAVYALFAGAALVLFKATDPNAQSTKNATLLLGTATAIVIVWEMAASRPLPAAGSLISVICLLGAAALFLWSISEQRRQLRKLGTAAELQYAGSSAPPAQLTVSGPYQFIRHPIYSAYALGWLGGAIASMSPLALVMTFIMLVLYVVSAKTEEKAISASELGPAYRVYQASTAMFVPFLF